jgi:hypothetical protein
MLLMASAPTMTSTRPWLAWPVFGASLASFIRVEADYFSGMRVTRESFTLGLSLCD